MGGQRLVRLGTEPGGAVLDHGAIKLRHARSRCAGARRVGENMQIGEPTLVHEPDRVLEHGFGLGRETGDHVGPEGDFGPGRLQAFAQGDGVVAQMAALHALEDHVVAGLQGEVQIGRDPGLAGNGFEQRFVDLDRIDRGQTQARQVGHVFED